MGEFKEYLKANAEKMITPKVVYYYARRQKRRIPELEHIILKDTHFAVKYAAHVINRDVPPGQGVRWPEAEKRILHTGNTRAALDYAHHIFRGRWKEAEPLIWKKKMNVEDYLRWTVDGERVPEFEAYVKEKSPLGSWARYVEDVKQRKHSEEEKWSWIKNEGLNEFVFEIINNGSMSQEMQEYILQHRPDLAAEIKNLDQVLMKKYQHEVELGNVDL
jgi:hypothetical protein